MSIINILKYYGRGMVLPTEKIRNIIFKTIVVSNITSITDFGSGTLFWSKWLAETFNVSINACDTLYTNEVNRPYNNDTRITLFPDINEVLVREAKGSEEKRRMPSLFAMLSIICLLIIGTNLCLRFQAYLILL